MDSEQAVKDGLVLLTSSLRQQVDAMQVRAYLRGLSKVPADVITDAADQLIAQLAAQPMGKRYFPAVPDWLAACAEVVKERRARALRTADGLREKCGICADHRGWQAVVIDGVERLQRCPCFVNGQELIAQAGQPIALPPAREIEGDVA